MHSKQNSKKSVPVILGPTAIITNAEKEKAYSKLKHFTNNQQLRNTESSPETGVSLNSKIDTGNRKVVNKLQSTVGKLVNTLLWVVGLLIRGEELKRRM